MNKIILWVIGAIALVALLISVGNSVGGNQSVPASIVGDVSGSTNYDTIGLGINDKYVQMVGRRIGMTTSSQIPCSIQTPAATSSLVFASVKLTSTSVATTTTWVLSWAASATATTTSIATIGTAKTASAAFDYAVASPTTYLPASSYINVWVLASSSAELANVAGQCQAEFIVL